MSDRSTGSSITSTGMWTCDCPQAVQGAHGAASQPKRMSLNERVRHVDHKLSCIRSIQLYLRFTENQFSTSTRKGMYGKKAAKTGPGRDA